MSGFVLPDADVVSRATIEGVAFDFPVKRTDVERFLRRWDLGIAADSTQGVKEHSITYELWSVTDGRPTLGGVDRHDAAAGWTGLVEGMTVATFGAGLSWLEGLRSNDFTGAMTRAAEGARAGFEIGSSIGSDRGRQTSRMLALGPYHELVLGIPDVVVGRGSTRYTAVLAMITDSAIARAIDGWFDYGYGKKLGAFAFLEPGTFEVTVNGEVWVNARFSSESRGAARRDRQTRLNARWTQPLLGGLRDGRLRASRLDRKIDGRRASCSGICGKVDVSRSALEPLPAAPSRTTAIHVRGAVFTNVVARIGKPTAVR